MKRAICLYLHVHQPYRLREYSIFDVGEKSDYFNETSPDLKTNNHAILQKVASKSYLPTNKKLLELLNKYEDFRVSLSITGTLLEQLEKWLPEALESFKKLVDTGKVEILAETYYHSLAFFFSRSEFEKQIKMHSEKIESIFDVTPQVIRNTELAYNNDLAYWADKAGYKGILAEGWDKVLGWRSPNFVYRPAYTENIKLLLKNYKLSDDIAFRFSNRDWQEWPLSAEKFNRWINSIPEDQKLINLFMDYETFGEHQWHDTGIFDFLEHFPRLFLNDNNNKFVTPSEAIDLFEAVDHVDAPETITWADSERDLTAWLGNSMQHQATQSLYELEQDVISSKDINLISDWRSLQTSDHFYYMCTKWFNDGDVHAYFSPYNSPYDAFIAFMNTLRDMELRIEKSKGERHA